MEEEGTRKVVLEKKYCPNCFQQFEGAIETCPNDNAVLRGPKNDPWIGKVFADRYLVESVLGLGGMSVVYKAKHKLMDRVVAIKMLHNVLKHDTNALERFKLEAQAASALNHQNVITVYDFGVTPDGEPYFVMDCLEGESLKDLIERKGRLPYDRALAVFKQICDGLEAAHKRGIIHRDLKPANVIVTKQDDGSELVRLVDFGIAKMLPQAGKADQHLTKTGEVFGSPIYMSPEQCLGKELDVRSDIYSLGCVMYETLTGDVPFLGDGFLDTMNKHVGEIAKPITEVVPDASIPPELENVINRCMAKDPKDRFATVGELRDTLVYITTTLLGSSTAHISSISRAAPQAKSPAPKVTVAGIVAGVAATLLVGAVGFVSLWPGPADDRGTPLNKMIWQVTMSDADSAMKDKKYPAADEKLNSAETLARSFGDNKARLMVTLKKKGELYDQWDGHLEALAKINREISDIETDKVTAEATQLLARAEAIDAEPAAKGTEGSAQLRADAKVPMLLATARKLHGRGLFELEERLLTKALDVSKKKLGNDSIQTAEIGSQLAECLNSQRKFEKVRPLLENVVAVYKNKSDTKPDAYALALSKIGQFDVDRNDFVKAGPELAESLKIARSIKGQNEVLALCLRSNADFLTQTGKTTEAAALRQEADKLGK